MIPPPFLAKIPWRLVAASVALFAFLAVYWRVTVWHDAYKTLPGVKAALKAEEACQEPSKCFTRQAKLQADADAKSKEVIDGLEAEIADLRNRPIPRRVIRVCNDRGVQSPVAPGAPDGASPGTGDVHGTDEFDTGPLRSLAREADEVSAQLRALQQWNEALSKAPEK